ncbi:hypothetical protein Tsubulata_008914 [Turnera subulata]|uniref:Rho GDP-dissociation inhibitor 1 n=1 Tax=Turnera subulata TaxID=218843 RepID=A0A9Q0FEF5_9ROSI|nr:hypothetical protein Tsubulata_008914 [Turnera subulata]
MSAAVGTFSTSKEIAFSNGMENEELKSKNTTIKIAVGDEAEKDHIEDHEEDADNFEEDDSKLKFEAELDLGPQDDESLKRWKEQLLGSVDLSSVGESKEPEVKILSLTILCPGRPDLVLPIPFTTKSKRSLFILKEGSLYHLRLSFNVSNNIVSGLKYTNTVWKTGVRVDHTKVMLGTFSPQQEPYAYELEEETTPSGIFARGSYSARTKIVDDDGKCYLDVSYHFEIQKNWPSSS